MEVKEEIFNKIIELFNKGWNRGICYGYIMAYEDIKGLDFKDKSKLYDYINNLYRGMN